jgi:hypothetical protein
MQSLVYDAKITEWFSRLNGSLGIADNGQVFDKNEKFQHSLQKV